MRQRPVDVNSATIFVDTQPRPVKRDAAGRPVKAHGHHSSWGSGMPTPAGVAGPSQELTPVRALALLGLALALLAGGAYLVRGNHYAPLHRRIQDEYYTYLQAWDQHRASFVSTSWSLRVEGLAAPIPLRAKVTASKRAVKPLYPAQQRPAREYESTSEPKAAAGSEYEGEEDAVRPGSNARTRQIAQSSLVEFRAEGVLEALLGAHAGDVPFIDKETVKHSKLWTPIVPELRRGRSATLLAEDATGTLTQIELGPLAFSRHRTVAAGGEARCRYGQHGVWQPDSTCLVHEYFWALCVKVARDPLTGQYRLSQEPGGGPGCSPDSRWEAVAWKRLDEGASTVHGRVYLPASARNATSISVRHTADPAILERDAVRRLAPHMEQQILLHAIGLAMCFLSLVLAIAVGAFAAPRLLAWARGRLGGPGAAAAGGRRARAGGAGGKSSGDEWQD